VNGAGELVDPRARLDALDDEVTVLGSLLEDLRNGDLELPGAGGPPSPPADATDNTPAGGRTVVMTAPAVASSSDESEDGTTTPDRPERRARP